MNFLKIFYHKFKNIPIVLKWMSIIYYITNNNTKKIDGKENFFYFQNAFLKNVYFDIVGSNNKITFGERTQLSNAKIYIRGNNHSLQIDNECRISGSFWFEDNECIIHIGKRTTIENAHMAVTEPNKSIIIGQDCMLSNDIDIRTGDSHSIIDMDSQQRINYANDVIIGDHVWIGAHCSILKGVKIANNVIVGTRTLVVKSIESENVVTAGNPNKIIKYNVNWLRDRVYDK